MISRNAASILFKVANAQAPKQIQQTTTPTQPASNNQVPQGSATQVAPSAQQKPAVDKKSLTRTLSGSLSGYMAGNPAMVQRVRQSIQGSCTTQPQQPAR